MKQLLLAFSLLCVSVSAFGAQLEWFTDIEAAQAKARRENKFLLLDFTGSDWCGWCMKLKSEVFDKPEYAEFANSRIVMAEVDFPRNKPQTDAQKKINAQLAHTLNIKGYPTIVLLNAEGRPMGQTGYVPGGPPAFIAEIEGIIKGRPAAAPAPSDEPEPPRKPFVYVPVAPPAATHYNELALKAVSGSKTRRMAMINNETFFVGDTARVKVQDTKVEVVCKEIREDSVLITADGKELELKLGKH